MRDYAAIRQHAVGLSIQTIPLHCRLLVVRVQNARQSTLDISCVGGNAVVILQHQSVADRVQCYRQVDACRVLGSVLPSVQIP